MTDTSPPGPLGAPLLGALMRMPVDEIRRRMLAALHEQGFDDLIPAHLIVLRWPGPDGLRPIEVAEQTGMSKQALNYLLGQLEEAGYLERVDDPDDRRSKRIRMTKRGWDAGKVMRAAVGEVEGEFVDAHGEKELETLLELLTHLNVVLGTRT
ncbi:MAG TPA: MarR family transcriptional regulator [Solirubrobacterales bacterium]|nr:MarR family transcriptional regulator [Solirubrobacterales bacterium]